jgi:hypothetical protein
MIFPMSDVGRLCAVTALPSSSPGARAITIVPGTLNGSHFA